MKSQLGWVFRITLKKFCLSVKVRSTEDNLENFYESKEKQRFVCFLINQGNKFAVDLLKCDQSDETALDLGNF